MHQAPINMPLLLSSIVNRMSTTSPTSVTPVSPVAGEQVASVTGSLSFSDDTTRMTLLALTGAAMVLSLVLCILSPACLRLSSSNVHTPCDNCVPLTLVGLYCALSVTAVLGLAAGWALYFTRPGWNVVAVAIAGGSPLATYLVS